MSVPFSPGSGDLTLASSEQACESPGNAKSIPTDVLFSGATGPTCPATRTCEISSDPDHSTPETASPTDSTSLTPSISSAADSPARISPERGAGPESRAPSRVSGPSLPEWFANYDHDTSLWRTSQGSLLEGGQP